MSFLFCSARNCHKNSSRFFWKKKKFSSILKEIKDGKFEAFADLLVDGFGHFGFFFGLENRHS